MGFYTAFLGSKAYQLFKDNSLPINYLNDKVKRILWVLHQTNLSKNKSIKATINTKEHQNTALKIAEEGIVLLKNKNILPIQPKKISKIAIIGDNATHLHAEAGGSSLIAPFYEISPLQGLKRFLGSDSSKITFSQGYEVSKKQSINKKLWDEALENAKKADVVLFFGGFVHGYSSNWNDNAFDAENIDKQDIKLPFGQDSLIKAITKVNKNTIVILVSGGACNMNYWIKSTKGVIQQWYAGMEGGTAIANVIFGKTNPSGKLPVTFPVKLEDMSAHSKGNSLNDTLLNYHEGIYVGYRHFETKKIKPLFEFGFGLSYTKFDFSNLQTEISQEKILAKFDIQNTGNCFGAEVAQVYISKINSETDRPSKELKGFEKIDLKSSEKQNISIEIPIENLMYFDEKTNNWKLEKGLYMIEIGNSSRNILLKKSIVLN